MAENILEFENPGEQLRLSSLVNRFCDRKAEEFDPNIHVEEARKIARALDPKIKFLSSPLWFENMPASSSKSSSSRIAGTTDLGEAEITGIKNRSELKANISLRKEKMFSIGAYRITKFKVSGRYFVLNFKHFMKHGIGNRYMGVFPPYWQIFYDSKSLEPTTISETRSKVKEFKLPFLKKTYRHVVETPHIVYTTLGKKLK